MTLYARLYSENSLSGAMPRDWKHKDSEMPQEPGKKLFKKLIKRASQPVPKEQDKQLRPDKSSEKKTRPDKSASTSD